MNEYTPALQQLVNSAPFDIELLVDDGESLRITMDSDEDNKLELAFSDYYLYRKIDEGDALLTLEKISRSGGLGKWFYVVEESNLVSWFNAERCVESSDNSLQHFVIAASSDIVDVISSNVPRVNWV